MTSLHRNDEELLALALGETSDAESEAAAAHLRECAECRETLATYRAVASAVKESETRRAPASVLARLLEAQRAPAPSPARPAASRRRPPALAFTAVALLALLAGFWVGQRSVERAPAASPDAPVAQDAGRELPEPPRIPFVSA